MHQSGLIEAWNSDEELDVLTDLNILLAEDNPTNQMVAMQMLESLGASVTLAVDGAEALEKLTETSYDVALIDIEMPRISGIDLIRRLRSMDAPVAKMPLIALTAYVMREHRIAIDDAGADGIIAKPILSIEQFGEDIRALIPERPTAPAPVAEVAPEAAETGEADIDIAVFDGLKSAFTAENFVELTNRIRSDVGTAQEQIDGAWKSGDLTTLRSATHILISVAGVIGARRLQELARCLNSAGHEADTETIERDGPELVAEAARVLDFVRGSSVGVG